MAYKTKEEEGAKQNSIFALTHKMFDETVDPKAGDILGREYNLLDANRFDQAFLSAKAYPQQKWRLPGMTAFGFMPTFGVADVATDPVNLSATNLFKKIQNALRKTNLRYMSSDIIMQLMAHGSLFLTYNYIKRGYECTMNMNPWNTYVNKYLFNAMGLDYDDFVKNRNQIHYDLVQWAATLSSLPIPANFSVFAMHSSFVSQFFADVQEEKKYQMYIFNPSYVWKYPTFEGTRPATYELVPVKLYDETGNTFRTYEEVRTIFIDLLNALINAQDFQDINSNLLSTFESGTFYSVSAPSIDSIVPISYSQDMLDAITNARIVRISGDSMAATWAPKCTADNVVHIQPQVNGLYDYEAYALGSTNVINATKDSINNIDTARCLRWCPVFKNIGRDYGDPEGRVAADCLAVGTEVITGMTTWGDSPYYDGYLQGAVFRSNAMSPADESSIMRAAILSGFRFHPTMFATQQRESEPFYMTPLAQWHYASEISMTDVQNVLHAYLWQALLTDVQ